MSSYQNIEVPRVGVKYPAKLHAQSVARCMAIGHGLIYLKGHADLSIEDSDMTYPFRQDRYFYYITGVDIPDCHVLYDVATTDLTLCIPENTVKKNIWTGGTLTPRDALQEYDMDVVEFTSKLNGLFRQWQEKNPGGTIYVKNIAHETELVGMEWIANSAFDKMTTNIPTAAKIDSGSLVPAINVARTIKDFDEINLIREACRISSLAHDTIYRKIDTFRSEAEVHALFVDICIRNSATLQAYPPIVGVQQNASILHYTKNNSSFGGKELLLIDAGCEWKCYASDITRTLPIYKTGWRSTEARALYELVQEMQDTCIKMLKPGKRYYDIYLTALELAARGLMRLGVFKSFSEDSWYEKLIESGAVKAFFPHGLGHHVGLDVHDKSAEPINIEEESCLSNGMNLRDPCTKSSSHLETGMVITVEPGVYFNDYALKNWWLPKAAFKELVNLERLEDYITLGGARIEDVVLITKSSYEILSTAKKHTDS